MCVCSASPGSACHHMALLGLPAPCPLLSTLRPVPSPIQVMVFFDTDHDQCLSLAEFRSCVTGLGLVMTEEQITAKMAELDKTGDGRLNFDEFAQFMAVQLSEPGRTLADIIAAFRELAEEKAYLPQVRLPHAHVHTCTQDISCGKPRRPHCPQTWSPLVCALVLRARTPRRGPTLLHPADLHAVQLCGVGGPGLPAGQHASDG